MHLLTSCACGRCRGPAASRTSPSPRPCLGVRGPAAECRRSAPRGRRGRCCRGCCCPRVALRQMTLL